MRLSRLRLQNFRQHADSEIEFDSGLTGIIGANGTGKTTILEAIAWALYGGDTIRGGKDSIRFSRAAPRASVRVELEFELAGHRYRVVRGLTMAELYLDGNEAPIANSVTAVGDLLQRRLGMTRAEFYNTYFTGQKELSVMRGLSAPARARFLSRVLGYEKLRVAQELCEARRKELRSEVQGLRSAMPDPAAVARQREEAEARVATASARCEAAEGARAAARAALDALTPRWQAMQRAREERLTLEAERRVAEGEAGELGRAAERLEADLATVAEARAALIPLAERLAGFHEAGNRLTRLRELAVHDGRRQAMLDGLQGLETEMAAVRAQRDAIAGAAELEEQVTLDLERARRAVEEAQGSLEARRTEWVRDRQEAETRRNQLRAQWTELRDQRERLLAAGAEGTCPTCQRPLEDHYRDVLELLDGQLAQVEAEGSYYRQRLEQLEDMPEDVRALDVRRRRAQGEVATLEKRLGGVQAEVRQLEHLGRDLAHKAQRRDALEAELAALPGGYDAAGHKALEAEFERLLELNTQANRLTMQVEREPALRRELDHVRRGHEAAAARIAALDARLAGLEVGEADFAALRDRHAAAQATVHEAALQAVAADSERQVAASGRERAVAAQAELDRTAARLAELDADRLLHEELHRAYTDLRTDLNFALRPELSELASAFLTELTDARYTELELDDRYDILVLEEGVPKPVISGGEEDMANLVLRLAISQMIAERSGQAFSLLVLDEVFGSLDDAHRQGVVALLRKLQDRFEQVILITHIEGVRDLLDRVLVVRYDERAGAARVEPGDAAVGGAAA